MSCTTGIQNYGTGYGGGIFGGGNCCCSFPTLVILILIVLQFSRRNHGEKDCDDDGGDGRGYNGILDNGILFIIALFYLSCCNPCRTGNYGGY